MSTGASIGVNSMEAQHLESKAGFTHKNKITGKEADEILYRVTFCEYANGFPKIEIVRSK